MNIIIGSRRDGVDVAWSVRLRVFLITGCLLFPAGLARAQPAVDYDALRQAVRKHPQGEAKAEQPKPSPDSQTERALYESAIAAARMAAAAGDYVKATELATLLVQGWPEDAAAKELLAEAQRGNPARATPSIAPTQAASDRSSNAALTSQSAKATKHELTVSGDFFIGHGEVTLPFLYSLSQVPGMGSTLQPTVADVDRKSTYTGATLSYAFDSAWCLELAYARSDSSSLVPIGFGRRVAPVPLPSSFSIKDNWYQADLKYTFPAPRGGRLSAYLRAGVCYIQADLTDQTRIPSLGLYNQMDTSTDLLGNIGIGGEYRLYRGERCHLGLQLEFEGFYGTRSQDSLETLDPSVVGLPLSAFSSARIDNTLFGVMGRAMVHCEYRLDQSGRMNLFVDGGVQTKITKISYPSGAGGFAELLWGPYAKLGFNYSF